MPGTVLEARKQNEDEVAALLQVMMEERGAQYRKPHWMSRVTAMTVVARITCMES